MVSVAERAIERKRRGSGSAGCGRFTHRRTLRRCRSLSLPERRDSIKRSRETMRMSVHLNFQGNCADAFAFYAKVFKVNDRFQTTYGDAPGGSPVPPDWKDKIMHASIPLGNGLL